MYAIRSYYAVSDYPEIEALQRTILDREGKVSVASLRIDSLSAKDVITSYSIHYTKLYDFDVFRRGEDLSALLERCRHFPLVVKPAREGSTIGVSIVRTPDELAAGVEEAGLMDGLSRLAVIWKITLPLSLPAMASVSLYVFMIAWNEFLFAFMFLDDPGIFTLPRGVRNNFV